MLFFINGISLTAQSADALKSAELTESPSQLISKNKVLLSKSVGIDRALVNSNIGMLLLKDGKVDDAFFYFTNALNEAGTQKCTRTHAFAEANLAYIEVLRGRGKGSGAKISNAKFCARELNDLYLESEIEILLGNMKMHQGKYSEAFGAFFKSKEIKEDIKDVSGLIEVHTSIAEVLCRIGQHSTSRMYLQDALSLNNEAGNVYHTSKINNLLALNYVKQKNINYANVYVSKALKAAKESGNRKDLAQIYIAMSEVNVGLTNEDGASLYLIKAKEIIDLADLNSLNNEYKVQQAAISLMSNDATTALALTKSIITGDKKYVSQYDLANAYELQTKAYYNLNYYKKAFELNEEYAYIKSKNGVDGAFKQFEQLKSKSEQVVTETEKIKTLAENEMEYQEKKTSDIIKYFLIFAFILASIILFVLYRQVRTKQISTAKLEQRNSLINKQNQELHKMNTVLDDARQQAEAGSIARSNFLAMTSHEIRTPMNGIMGMASLMLETPLNTEQKKYVETIQTSSENLLTILNDILDFSKIEAGKMNLESTLIDLDKLLEEVMIIFSKQAKDKNIQLSKFIGNAMIKQFRGDILRIRQVLINLVSNAIKFTDNGYVNIIVEIDELLRAQTEDARIAKLKFSVKDDGIGISDEKQKKIFESFEQEDTSTSRKYGGIGLGLSISKKLVELMGGEIGLTSEKNLGTTFYFTLNVEIPKALAKHETIVNLMEEGNEMPLTPTGKFADEYPLKILVAEDNPFNKLFIDKLFEKFGYNNAHHAENGIEVLKKLELEDIDIILMDIQMPEMDGMEATQRIIQKYGDSRPLIIALTADATEASKHEYLDAGMDGFLSKPFKQEALQEILKENSKKVRSRELV
ncbi:ATP-binding protein [Bacteroidia bacterium]|nr:ATP-binding protein [Bacteroidia bacterium]MDB9881889.1 ATP-binding protein [Bacteroidia bacterium]MDC1394920.1 ATP-binding protein [Bacteroidia bacterium]